MNRVKKVAFTLYPITDMLRARAFYEGILGLTPGHCFNGEFQEYDFGGTTLAIDSSPMPFSPPGSQKGMALEVLDLRGWIPELRAKGVPFAEAVDENGYFETPVCFMSAVKDPDGNIITLHECK